MRAFIRNSVRSGLRSRVDSQGLRIVLLIILFLSVSLLCSVSTVALHCSDIAIIVLGTRPLDHVTPSLDMFRRVEKGIELHLKYPQAMLIFTGGKTAGPVSEARMMMQLAVKRGIPEETIILEEQSRSTNENAQFTAWLVNDCAIKKTILVTRPAHLERAVKTFDKYPVFGKIQPAAARISQGEIIQNLQEYLVNHQSPEVQELLERIKKEQQK